MPKGKRKGKYEHRRTEQEYSSEEDAGIDMTNDNYSETSGQSDLKSIHDEGENDSQEKLEEKVLEIIDGLSARANAARASALVSLRAALQRRYLAPVLSNQRATLADHVARALRRGRDAERRAAAAVAPLLALQIGEEGTEEFMAEVRPALVAACTDKTSSLETRAECCSSLAALCYLLEEDVNEILEIMQMYETIFSSCYLKGDGSVKVSGAAVEEGAWCGAALDAWSVLLGGLPAPAAQHALQAAPAGRACRACCARRSTCAPRRPALAVAPRSRAAPSRAAPAQRLDLRRSWRRDSQTRTAPSARPGKLQRATFSDILKYFEEDAAPSVAVRVGAETLQCDTWAALGAYAALAAALGAGLQALAPHARPLRAALGLDDVLPADALPKAKLNKLQRHLQNTAACKARTLARNKNRDKRSAALAL
ncbi:LOW QUALITY PROTEIN: interferon-related developmental regulator 2 [Bombyx mandarina]|uniref:LOW QUALITY PROTEIN: interferon-related developmental regulator 2 n=1 Tax=Bombyx mandarina TaxID=7092 RepID=A0A6J2JA96_BOMMA|nr:LOW QUALITY PROTEIN: interferon-related developmental regulator 2 [Bombyx mandarina]